MQAIFNLGSQSNLIHVVVINMLEYQNTKSL